MAKKRKGLPIFGGALQPIFGYTIGINPVSAPQDILLPPPQPRPEIGQKKMGGFGVKWMYEF